VIGQRKDCGTSGERKNSVVGNRGEGKGKQEWREGEVGGRFTERVYALKNKRGGGEPDAGVKVI